MDIELARTFVEIVSTGSFIKAAERLHVAQTTVSARVRLLEQLLGRPLFVRNKAGATLTPAGEQFLRFAPTFVQLWQRRRQQVAVPEGHRAVLTVGSEVSLWQPLLVEWVRAMRRAHPDIALRVHVDVPAGFDHPCGSWTCGHRHHVRAPPPAWLGNRPLDGGRARPDNDEFRSYRADDPKYVHVEWGPDFSLHHAVSFPDCIPSLVVNLGPLALNYVLSEGGSGYFRMNAIKPYLKSGALHLVPQAPHFAFPVYAVHSANVDVDTFGNRPLGAPRCFQRKGGVIVEGAASLQDVRFASRR